MRLDAAVAERARLTRSQARGLILAGRVRVNGETMTKAGAAVRDGAFIDVDAGAAYVSRGGEKLEHALRVFSIDVSGSSALDVGASTGGFTDCLLRHGASSVTAVDVGYGQLAWKLRTDPRVRVMERANFRHLADDAFDRPFDIIVVDASFISLRTIVERARVYLAPEAPIVALVKPQFEAGRKRVGRGGVVRDPEVHRAVLREVRDAMGAFGLALSALTASPLRGPAGNREFLARIDRCASAVSDAQIDEAVREDGQ